MSVHKVVIYNFRHKPVFAGMCMLQQLSHTHTYTHTHTHTRTCMHTSHPLSIHLPTAVKKFPRKQRNSTSGEDSSGSRKSSKDGRQGKRTKSSSTSSKDSCIGSSTGSNKSSSVAAMMSPSSKSMKEAPPTTNGNDVRCVSGDTVLSPQSIKQESSLRLSETDLVHLKFNVSPPEAMMYLDSNTSVPQLFSYGGSLENLNEQSSKGSPSKLGAVGGGSNSDLTRSSSNPNLSRSGSSSIATNASGGRMGMDIGKVSASHSHANTTSNGSTTMTTAGVSSRSSTVELLQGLIKHAQTTEQNQNFLHLPSTVDSLSMVGRGEGVARGGGGGKEEMAQNVHDHHHHHHVHPDQLSQNLLSLSGTRKRQRLDSSSSAVVTGSRYPSGGSGGTTSLSAPHTPITPCPAPPHLLPQAYPHAHSHSQPPSRGPSPEIQLGGGGGGINHSSSVYSSHNPTPYGTPHATPHATPTHTPMQSPLPSPNSLTPGGYHYPPPQPPPTSTQLQGISVPSPLQQSQTHLQRHTPQQTGLQSFQNVSNSLPQQKRVFFAASPPSAVNPLSLPGFSAPNILLQPQANALFLNTQHTQMPFRVLPMSSPGQSVLTPLVPFAAPTSFSSSGELSSDISYARHFGLRSSVPSRKSPFTIVPIPSINKTQPDELPVKVRERERERERERIKMTVPILYLPG